jgi:zinc D-Ala-D-Ala dipeptidase
MDTLIMSTKTVISISSPEVLNVPIAECGEPLADVRKIEGVVISDKYAEDHSCFFIVRQSVFDRLQHAQRLLAGRCTLLFGEALRPLAVQQALRDRVRLDIANEHPDWSAARIDAETALYVAPVDAAPPHSTGGAVDLTLADFDGKELPMGSAVNGIEPASYSDFELSNPDERRNRALLFTVMREAGFVNYDAEWWHWSYGDRYWALRSGKSHAIYSAVERDATLLHQLQQMIR